MLSPCQILDSEVISTRSECKGKGSDQLWSTDNNYLRGSPAAVTPGMCSFPYPSDHSAVLSTVLVRPIESYWLIRVSKRKFTRLKEEIVVCVTTPPSAAWTIAIVPADADPATSTLVSMREELLIYRRCNRFGTSMLSAGEYDAVLVNPSTNVQESRVRFYLRNESEVVDLQADCSQCAVTSHLTLQWTGSPGDRDDFIGIYLWGEVDVNSYVGLAYTGATFSGNMTLFLNDRSVFPDGLRSGKYLALFMNNDEYIELARVAFEF
jgi:hypothetical protein